MRYFTLLVLSSLPLSLGFGDRTRPENPETAAGIELKDVTVAELDKKIAEQKGKVVLINCWFFDCTPCKEKFPKFVELHQKYAKKGLVCISLDVSEEELSPGERPKVVAFLKKQKSDMTNFIFKDEEDRKTDWLKRHKVVSAPKLALYDRDGKWHEVSETATPKELEEMVAGFLGAE